MIGHIFRAVRRRYREARYLDQSAGPRQLASWAWDALVYDLRVLADVFGGPR